MAERLAGEIMDAANNAGNAVKRREDMHKHGRGEQGVRALSLVIFPGADPEFRDSGQPLYL